MCKIGCAGERVFQGLGGVVEFLLVDVGLSQLQCAIAVLWLQLKQRVELLDCLVELAGLAIGLSQLQAQLRIVAVDRQRRLIAGDRLAQLVLGVCTSPNCTKAR